MSESRIIPILVALLVLLTGACAAEQSGGNGAVDDGEPGDVARWLKGNLHTHSLWSDGDDFPEMVLAWYRDAGYDFAVLSDHNVLAREERWVVLSDLDFGESRLAAYRERFGDRVRTREGENGLEVRLATFDEYREAVEKRGEFLILEAEEISDRFEDRPVHLNATNLADFIAPQGGDSLLATLQNNVDAVLEQRERTGRPMIVHVNHPNYRWALTVEALIGLRGERFFEVYNGHPAVNNEGDEERPSTERIWDEVLTARRLEGRPLLFGLAVDDAHDYGEPSLDKASPGRGWVRVRADELDPPSLISALEAGDFYASSGVELRDVAFDGETLRIAIAGEPGVAYTTRFVGSRENDGEPEIGIVLAEVEGTEPAYRLGGDELYVRATVVSTRPMPRPYREGEMERAWVQPVAATGSR